MKSVYHRQAHTGERHTKVNDSTRVKKEVGSKEIAAHTVQEVEKLAQFLDVMKQSASFYFRRNIKLSDVELEKHLEDGIVNILHSMREYSILYHFVMQNGLEDQYNAFKKTIADEITLQTKKEEV